MTWGQCFWGIWISELIDCDRATRVRKPLLNLDYNLGLVNIGYNLGKNLGFVNLDNKFRKIFECGIP